MSYLQFVASVVGSLALNRPGIAGGSNS